MSKTKVFGIGLSHTGTKTLGRCLRILGYEHLSYSPFVNQLHSEYRLDELIQLAHQYESFEDWPWGLIYERLHSVFPDAKFILTLRRDTDTWYESLCRHAKQTGPSRIRQYVYGYAMPEEHRSAHTNIYEQHREAVTAFFADKSDQLLVATWDNGHRWQEICEFLGKSIPDTPFPYQQSTRDS